MEHDTYVQLFRKSLPKLVVLREILGLMGSTEGKTCLDLGSDNPVVSRALRERGGTWHTLTRNEEVKRVVAEAVEENVEIYDGGPLPFDDKTFDMIVLSDILERTEADDQLVTECHRVAKSDSTLIVSVPHAKPWSIVGLLQSIVGPTYREMEWARPGYTEAQLFHLLKHGFDVHAVRSCLRALVKIVDTIVQLKANRLQHLEATDDLLVRLYSKAYSFYWIAYQLDVLLLFTRGYSLIALAKRHPWRPRKAPVLNDGRVLTDVVLSKIKK